jgi:hypothetical protein
MVNKTNRDKYNIRNNIMKIKHLLEGTEPKLPGAVSGIQIMTPQQFVAKSAAGEEPEPEKDVTEGNDDHIWGPQGRFAGDSKVDIGGVTMKRLAAGEKVKYDGIPVIVNSIHPNGQTCEVEDRNGKVYRGVLVRDLTRLGQGMAEGLDGQVVFSGTGANGVKYEIIQSGDDFMIHANGRHIDSYGSLQRAMSVLKNEVPGLTKGVAEADKHSMLGKIQRHQELKKKVDTSFADIGKAQKAGDHSTASKAFRKHERYANLERPGTWTKSKEQGVAEATKLPAQTRDLKGDELEAYLDRIRKQEKQKTDKYKMPYIHRSSVMGYYNEEGKKYNTDAIKAALKERPKALLKKNEKMKHSDGEQEQFFNIGFAALTGIALDENTNEIIIVNTCPGAGSCKVDCFAMKGGKIQFQGPWLSDGRILTYLLNNPDGFFSQLKSEIEKEELKGKKGGYKVSIRWHDAGDFFSPEYAGLAFKLANELPNVQFYAYTKIAGVALGQKPDNFMINWSEGASTSQEKQVKAADPNLERTKNSRIVPSNLFYDLLVKDEKKNLVKGAEGQWQVIPDKLPELKQRIAKEYGISPSSILSYTEWDQKTQGGKKETPIKYNVIITPGEPDITAKSSGVLSTLLLKH